ncbi:MAG: hypothetical protein IJS60_06700 [Abditibacteriota bacterium]|nr:hypothetical protein [Abditibacteriota bacterium]
MSLYYIDIRRYYAYIDHITTAMAPSDDDEAYDDYHELCKKIYGRQHRPLPLFDLMIPGMSQEERDIHYTESMIDYYANIHNRVLLALEIDGLEDIAYVNSMVDKLIRALNILYTVTKYNNKDLYNKYINICNEKIIAMRKEYHDKEQENGRK